LFERNRGVRDGGTCEEAADILGDTENIVKKTLREVERRKTARISELLARIWHAKKRTRKYQASALGKNDPFVLG